MSAVDSNGAAIFEPFQVYPHLRKKAPCKEKKKPIPGPRYQEFCNYNSSEPRRAASKRRQINESLWLHRLPKSIQAILTFTDSGSLGKLAAAADKIHEFHPLPGACEVSRDTVNQMARLQQTVVVLKATVSKLGETDVGSLKRPQNVPVTVLFQQTTRLTRCSGDG